MSVGGEGKFDGFAVLTSIRGSKMGEFADKIDNAIPQQRFPAGDTDLCNPHSHQHARHAQVIGEWQVTVERSLVAGAAIDTLVIAAVGDGDPQVGDSAAEFVAKKHGAASSQHSAKNHYPSFQPTD